MRHCSFYCVGLAMVAVFGLTSEANGQSPVTYTSTTVSAIPNNSPSTMPLYILAAGGTLSITGLTVRIDVTHAWDADLDIALISPTGAYIMLTSDNGG